MNRLKPVRETGPVEFRPWRPMLAAYLFVGAVLLGAMIGVASTQITNRSALGDYEYRLWRWQADTFASTIFQIVGIGADPDDEAGYHAVQRYFELTSLIRAEADRGNPDLPLIEALTNERAGYERDVQAAMRRWITEAVVEAGLEHDLPLFSGVSLTWPPVAFELTSPPRVLVRSPRDDIRRAGDTLLRSDLSLAQVIEIEERTADEDTSTLVVSIGGIASYPAIIRNDRTYGGVLTTAAHEWVHHYLAFYPLGWEWMASQEGKILNETVADIAGEAIAAIVRERHPISFPDGLDGRAPPGPAATPGLDFNTFMRELRLDIDALLADGLVDEAERLMEEQRQHLEENGIHIRRINQAYFAFYGTYGTSPQASDPIGDKMRRVWELTQDAGTFLVLVRDLQSAEDLDALLERLESAIEEGAGTEVPAR